MFILFKKLKTQCFRSFCLVTLTSYLIKWDQSLLHENEGQMREDTKTGILTGQRQQEQSDKFSKPNYVITAASVIPFSLPYWYPEALFHFHFSSCGISVGLWCHVKTCSSAQTDTLIHTTVFCFPSTHLPALTSNGSRNLDLNHAKSHLLFYLILMTNLFFWQEKMTLLVIPPVPVAKIN